MQVKTSGFRELNANLGEMKKGAAKGALRRAIATSLKPIQSTAQRLAPVDDGQLRDSIVISPTLSKNARGKSANVRQADGGFRAAAKTSVTVYVGTTNRNGVPREFGSMRSPAHPFMRPAWDMGRAQLLDDVKGNLADEINKTIARAEKRARKALK